MKDNNVKYIEFGNIFELEGVTNYAHGCNCSGAMGKGIAVQFKILYPEMYKQYKTLCQKGDFTLGDVFEYYHGNGYVFNLGTQKTWRTKAQLDAVEQSLIKMLEVAKKLEVSKIALPKIAAGLGGLDWKNVKTIINNVSKKFPNIQLVVVENFKP